MQKTRRITMGQALIGFLKNQYLERDGGAFGNLELRPGRQQPRGSREGADAQGKSGDVQVEGLRFKGAFRL